MIRTTAVLFSLTIAVAVPAVAVAGRGHGPITITAIGGFSTQASQNHAVVGVHIAGSERQPRQPAWSNVVADVTAAPTSPPPVPTVVANSQLLHNPHPMGPDTLWYQGPPGQQCIYAPATSPLCFAVVQPNGRAINPAFIATEVARSMDLSLPPIEASPSASRSGLTGDQTWFWLARRPSRNQVTVNLGAETVTITADPSTTEWFFGDGGGRAGGPGVAYVPGPPPADAITHVYDTRCLPGDQGRDPNVLPSCGGDGYQVVARVSWTISFVATGPVAGSGGLPTRTTESELVYPVSEARAFLVGGSS
jgi:hypothetical protein